MIGFLRARWDDKVRALCSIVLLTTLPVAMSWVSFATVRGTLLQVAKHGRVVAPGDPSPHHLARTVQVVDLRIPKSRTCLARSLTCEVLLRCYGYTPTHRIGVDPESGNGFVAHSWLEYDGDILIGEVDDMTQYEALPPLDSEANP